MGEETLSDAFGAVIGVVVVRPGGHGGSSLEFVENDFSLGGVQRRAGTGVSGFVT